MTDNATARRGPRPLPSPSNWSPPLPPPSPADRWPRPPITVAGDLYERASLLSSAPNVATVMSSSAVSDSDIDAANSAERRPGPVRLGSAYRKVWWATAISRTGDGITQAALPLLALEITGDPRHVAWVYGMVRVPWMGMSLIAGALADRLNRRLMLLYADLSRLVVLAILGTVALGGQVQIWMLYVAALVIGTAESFYESANAAVIPAIVDSKHYEHAAGRLSAAETTTFDLLGPAVGALLFSVGVGLPFLVDAATFLVGSKLVFSLRNTFRDGDVTSSATGSLRADIAFGMRWLWKQPTLRALALLTGGLNFAFQCVYAPLAAFSADVLGLDDWGFGVLLVGASIGAIVGGRFVGGIAEKLGPAITLRVAVVGMSAAVITAGVLSNPIAVIAVLSIEGAAMVLYQAVAISTRMAAVPDHLRGRVNGAYILLASFGGPLGAGLSGLLAHWLGLRAPLIIGGILALAFMVAFVRPLSDAKLRAARHRIDLTERDGGTDAPGALSGASPSLGA